MAGLVARCCDVGGLELAGLMAERAPTFPETSSRSQLPRYPEASPWASSAASSDGTPTRYPKVVLHVARKLPGSSPGAPVISRDALQTFVRQLSGSFRLSTTIGPQTVADITLQSEVEGPSSEVPPASDAWGGLPDFGCDRPNASAFGLGSTISPGSRSSGQIRATLGHI